MTQARPTGQLDPVSRLQIMSEVIGGVVYAERYIPSSYQQVWTVVSDLEHQLPRLITGLWSFRVAQASPDRLEAQAVGAAGMRVRFDVVLRDGWCLMQSRFVVGAMAALPEGDGTRLAVLGGLRWRPARPLLWLLRPIGRKRGRVMIDKVEQQIGPG